ncbi:MAG: hypothetical protein QGF67_02575 [Lentisphaeria bacterium]|jgi:hypothetical protein|nr:hypothetical protein [Lentisphaeria bacterium]MDP7740298.1 hypothetical protein [Lentisphaeria bacterium]
MNASILADIQNDFIPGVELQAGDVTAAVDELQGACVNVVHGSES